ncbi:hypothetical protein RB195_012121 [Necator americanus]|uniref:Uncharacterized protein n=2 Tax=Necator americanus TaxID=51031 RepID=A0ABR1D8S4_NECAM|nr:hypothetical protein NECAME_16632 [Necator americanus]ETN85825.1 hypothetical protein NECAME_16632 [Necator americanus]
MLVLLLSLVATVNADVKTMAIVKSFNLRTTAKSDITCSSIQKVLIESTSVTSWNCVGETLAAEKDPGMWIVTEMDPMTPDKDKLTWRIEYTNGNLTDSFSTTKTIEKPLAVNNTIEITPKPKSKAILTNRVDIRAAEDDSKTEPPTTSKATEHPKDDPTTMEKTKPTEPATTTQTPAPSNKVTVTVNYIQFYSGQEPVYVNKHTAAVVIAVLEGLILGAILAVVIFRCYKTSQMRAAGMYPSSNDYQSNNMRNTVYYDNGGTLNYSRNPRPEIPSYRSPDIQAPVRLDSLPPRTQQPMATPNLMPVSATSPTASVTPAPLNNWPDMPGQAQPIRNIMDSDI